MNFSLRRTTRLAALLAVGLFAASNALAQTCTEEVGAEDAQFYVEQCLEVSPATRPPCNADNPCQMMWDEISRGCAMLAEDAPGFCSEY